jgi:hypothetical protein
LAKAPHHKNHHCQPKGPEQGHDFQLLISRHHFIGFDGEKNDHEDGCERFGIGDEEVEM